MGHWTSRGNELAETNSSRRFNCLSPLGRRGTADAIRYRCPDFDAICVPSLQHTPFAVDQVPEDADMLHVRDTLAMAQEDDANKNTKTKQQIKELQIQLKVGSANVFCATVFGILGMILQ